MENLNITVKTISDFVAKIEKRGKAFFYRGQSQDWPLIPSIGRVNRGGFDELLDFEQRVLAEFRRLASPYFERPPTKLGEWVLHAQHHGLPTRLLDWTSNPLKALYFAVEDKNNTNDGVIWSWDAFEVEWHEEFPNLNAEMPYFHRPTHLNRRIVAQESMFLVFPLQSGQIDIAPLDLATNRGSGRVEKFIIPGPRKKRIRDDLSEFGIDALSMYPTIESAVASVRDFFVMDVKQDKNNKRESL